MTTIYEKTSERSIPFYKHGTKLMVKKSELPLGWNPESEDYSGTPTRSQRLHKETKAKNVMFVILEFSLAAHFYTIDAEQQ